MVVCGGGVFVGGGTFIFLKTSKSIEFQFFEPKNFEMVRAYVCVQI